MKIKYMTFTRSEDWEQALQNNQDRPLLLLKHSTACPISSHAFGEFVVYTQRPKPLVDFALVRVIESRGISNQIETDLVLEHQSPQIILIKQRKVFWHATHWQVTYERIVQQVNQLIHHNSF
ncbi:bacillithiol system redox-active protein YtxJ [Paenibacillus psychroresistens]|nr:bacillithiol system redox-active protein YtxJ [Paenibacillus psychroresistens]